MLIYVASIGDIMYASVPIIQVCMRLKLDNSKSGEDSTVKACIAYTWIIIDHDFAGLHAHASTDT